MEKDIDRLDQGGNRDKKKKTSSGKRNRIEIKRFRDETKEVKKGNDQKDLVQNLRTIVPKMSGQEENSTTMTKRRPVLVDSTEMLKAQSDTLQMKFQKMVDETFKEIASERIEQAFQEKLEKKERRKQMKQQQHRDLANTKRRVELKRMIYQEKQLKIRWEAVLDHLHHYMENMKWAKLMTEIKSEALRRTTKRGRRTRQRARIYRELLQKKNKAVENIQRPWYGNSKHRYPPARLVFSVWNKSNEEAYLPKKRMKTMNDDDDETKVYPEPREDFSRRERAPICNRKGLHDPREYFGRRERAPSKECNRKGLHDPREYFGRRERAPSIEKTRAYGRYGKQSKDVGVSGRALN
jgi:hypothetical protein